MASAQTTRHSFELVIVSLLGVIVLAGTAFLVAKLTVPSPAQETAEGLPTVSFSSSAAYPSPESLFEDLPARIIPEGDLRERDRYLLHDWVQENWVGQRMRYRARILEKELSPRSDNTYDPEIRIAVTGPGASAETASFWFRVHGHDVEVHVGRGMSHEFRRLAWVGASIDFIEMIEEEEVGDEIVLEATIDEAFPTLVDLEEMGRLSALSDTGISIELSLSNVILERRPDGQER